MKNKVLKLLKLGYRNSEIAKLLKIKSPTITYYINRYLPKYKSIRIDKLSQINWSKINDMYESKNLMFIEVCKYLGISTYLLGKASKLGLFKQRPIEKSFALGRAKRKITPRLRKIFSESGRKGGKISAAKRCKRSKNEKYFFKLIKYKFPEATHNARLFNGWDADIVLPAQKVAIHWNGNWHYNPIFGKKYLRKIKIRDSLRYNAIIKSGYKNIIIKDTNNRLNKEFVQLKVKEVINKLLR